MKKITKLFFTPLISTIPIFAVVSCSKWNGWKKSSIKDKNLNYTFKEHEKPKKDESNIRDYSSVLSQYVNESGITKFLDSDGKERNQKTVTIDLTNLHNFYELIEIIAQTSSLKVHSSSKNNFDAYYEINQWQNLANEYFDKTIDKVNYKFKYQQETSEPISINIYPAFKGISDKLKDPNIDRTNTYFYQDTSGHIQLDAYGYPTAFSRVAKIASAHNLTGEHASPIVASLLKAAPAFALALSKLVDLPKFALNGFIDILDKLNSLFNDIYSNSIIKKWVQNIGKAIITLPDGNGNATYANIDDWKTKKLTEIAEDSSISFKGRFLKNILTN